MALYTTSSRPTLFQHLTKVQNDISNNVTNYLNIQ